MKFTIDRKYFYSKLSVAARAISVFSPLPALSGIHIDVKDDEIILTGSDSDVSIRTQIRPSEMNQLQIDSAGSIVMESKYLLEIVRKIDSTLIEFELTDYELVRIKSKNGEFNLNGIAANQYPAIDFKTPDQHLKLTSFQLRQIVSQTAFACGDNNQRPVLISMSKTIICIVPEPILTVWPEKPSIWKPTRNAMSPFRVNRWWKWKNHWEKTPKPSMYIWMIKKHNSCLIKPFSKPGYWTVRSRMWKRSFRIHS